MYTIIGSRAAMHHGVIPFRVPKDWDIISDNNGVGEFLRNQKISVQDQSDTPKGCTIFGTEGEIVEVELETSSDNTAEILERIVDDSDNVFCPPDWLYFLKMSHRFLKDSPHFWKTRADIEYMRSKGVRFPKDSEELFKERERLTYTNKLPNLNQKSKTFFSKDNVPYEFLHDDLHRIVAVLDRPAYTFFLKDGSEVMTDRSKFESLPEKIKLLSCLEESAVLCYERSQLPFRFEPDLDESFRMALSKAASSITGGYWREFCWDSIYKVLYLWDKLKDKIHYRVLKEFHEGTIKLYEGENIYE